MLNSLVDGYRKLKENHAFSVAAHARVVANYFRSRRELRDRPILMRSDPVVVEIELTNRCNLACVQCLRSRGLKNYALGAMSFETYQAVLAQFPYVLNLSLNGFGEALMHDRLFDIVEYSRRQRPWAKIGIYSNGMLIDEEKARRLCACGLTEINVSLDAADPDTYKRVRRGGTLSTVHEGIARLVRAKRAAGVTLPMIGMNFVMLNQNEGELVDFVEDAADLGVDFVNCITYATYDWGFENKRTLESYRRELAAARARMDDLGLRCKSFPSDDVSWSDARTPFNCSFFWGPIRVTYGGDVTLGCCTPFRETFSYGNVLEHPFRDIWNNALYRKNRELARRNAAPTDACASCDRFAKGFFSPTA